VTKSMARRKKHILTFEQEFDFDMIGICSHHSDYRLVWNINEKIGLGLGKSEDYFVHGKKGEEISVHSCYEFSDEENRLEYFLIKNKEQGHYLIPEKQSIDYFLFLCNNNAIEIDELIQKLKTISSVLAAYQFLPDEIASVGNLVFN
jgi:hypothetical protein